MTSGYKFLNLFISNLIYVFQAEEALYDANLLTQLDFNKTSTKFNPPITAVNTGEPWLIVRPLKVADFDRGFLQLLSQLTGIGNVSRMDFLSMFFASI